MFDIRPELHNLKNQGYDATHATLVEQSRIIVQKIYLLNVIRMLGQFDTWIKEGDFFKDMEIIILKPTYNQHEIPMIDLSFKTKDREDINGLSILNKERFFQKKFLAVEKEFKRLHHTYEMTDEMFKLKHSFSFPIDEKLPEELKQLFLNKSLKIIFSHAQLEDELSCSAIERKSNKI